MPDRLQRRHAGNTDAFAGRRQDNGIDRLDQKIHPRIPLGTLKIPADELRRDGINSWIAADRDPVVRDSLVLPHWPHSARPENLILLVAGGGHPTNSYWMEGYSPHVVGKEITLPKGFAKLLEQTERDIGCGAEACRI